MLETIQGSGKKWREPQLAREASVARAMCNGVKTPLAAPLNAASGPN